MHCQADIENTLYSIGVPSLNSKKAILGIATIGLLIGKEALKEALYKWEVISNRASFENYVMNKNLSFQNIDIIQEALEMIDPIIIGRPLVFVAEIILEQDLLDIVLHLEIYEKEKGTPLSCVTWINNLVCEIFKLDQGKSILNIDCGTGDFLAQMIENKIAEVAVGYTQYNHLYKTAKIRSFFTNDKIVVHRERAFHPPLAEKFDMIYNTYPLMQRYEIHQAIKMLIEWNITFDLRKKYAANLLWVVNSLHSLNDEGILVACVPNGVLFNDADIGIREYLIENNYVDAIISMPSGIAPYSGMSVSLMTLKKNRKENTSIRMIDATEMYEKQRKGNRFSSENIEQIVKLYSAKNNQKNITYVLKDEIIKNNYYLGIERYKTSKVDLLNAMPLELLTNTIFRGYQIKSSELDEIVTTNPYDTDYRMINISNVKTDGLIEKDLLPVIIKDVKKFSKYCLQDGDIIITAKNTTIKTAIYKSNEDYKALLTGNLIVIRANREKIDPYYLKAFLDSEKGQAEINKIRTGTTLFTITPNGLRTMMIELMPIVQQKEIANIYKRQLEEIEELQREYNKKVQTIKNIYNEMQIGN